MKRILTFIFFIAIPVLGGSFIGASNAPGAWTDTLVKPPFYPPAWVFAPVWTAHYVLIGIAGALVWLRAPRSAAMAAWIVQMALNFAWTPVFFTAHMIGLALVVIVALLVSVAAFIHFARRVSPNASWLFVPYLAWVAFATALNAAIFVLN